MTCADKRTGEPHRDGQANHHSTLKRSTSDHLPSCLHRVLFDAHDDIDRRREQLIEEIEGKLRQRVAQETLFSIRWTVV